MFLRYFKEKTEIKKFHEILEKRDFSQIPKDLDFDNIFKSPNKGYLLIMGRCFFELGKLDFSEKLNLKAHGIQSDEYTYFNLMKIAFIKRDQSRLISLFEETQRIFSSTDILTMFQKIYELMTNFKLPLSIYDVISAEKQLDQLILDFSAASKKNIVEDLRPYESVEKIKGDNIYEIQIIRARFFKATAMKYGTELSDDQKAKLFEVAHVLLEYYSPNKQPSYEPIAPTLDQAYLLISR